VPLGSFRGTSLDSLEIHTLAPGCPEQDPIEEVQQAVQIEGDIIGVVRTTVRVARVDRPQLPMTQALCATGVAERDGYYDYIQTDKFELRIDSVLPAGVAFGRWVLNGSARSTNEGTATGRLTSSLLVLDLVDTTSSPCSPFRLQGTIETTGDLGPVTTHAEGACGLSASYYFVDWTGMPSDLP